MMARWSSHASPTIGPALFALSAKRWELLWDALSFIIPGLLFLEVTLVGRLFVSELILLMLLPYLIRTRGRILLGRTARLFYSFAFLWLFSQVLTDVVRATPAVDYLRGWSKIVFIILNFTSLYLLLFGNKRRLCLFALGIAVAKVLSFFWSPTIYALIEPWKFGIGWSVSLIFVLSTQLRIIRRRPIMAVLIVATAGILNIFLGFRSLGFICLFSASYHFIQTTFKWSRPYPVRLGAKYIVLPVVMGGVLALAASNAYTAIAIDGWLGEATRAKVEKQSSGKYGMLLGGRSEMLASTAAIADSPIIGHGSWAKNIKYVQIMRENLSEMDYQFGEYSEDSELIPSHSHLFGAWVEAGACGALFWAWVFTICAAPLFLLYRFHEPMTPLYCFMAFGLLWDILFSPFGADARITAAFILVLMLTSWELLRMAAPQSASLITERVA